MQYWQRSSWEDIVVETTLVHYLLLSDLRESWFPMDMLPRSCCGFTRPHPPHHSTSSPLPCPSLSITFWSFRLPVLNRRQLCCPELLLGWLYTREPVLQSGGPIRSCFILIGLRSSLPLFSGCPQGIRLNLKLRIIRRCGRALLVCCSSSPRKFHHEFRHSLYQKLGFWKCRVTHLSTSKYYLMT